MIASAAPSLLLLPLIIATPPLLLQMDITAITVIYSDALAAIAIVDGSRYSFLGPIALVDDEVILWLLDRFLPPWQCHPSSRSAAAVVVVVGGGGVAIVGREELHSRCITVICMHDDC